MSPRLKLSRGQVEDDGGARNGGSVWREDHRRAGRSVRRRLRSEAWGEVRQSWRLLTLAFGGYASAGGLLVWVLHLWSPGGGPPFLAGVLVGSIPVIWQAFLVACGISQRSMGGEAEQWTARELRKLDERAWMVVHDVPLSRANVDHVAIGPGRIYAIETKWTSTAPHPAVVKRWARQAAGLASELQRDLTARGAPRDVVPVLVVWGRHARLRLGESPTMIGPTRVVVGGAAEAWLQRMREAADRFVIDHPAGDAVRGIIRDAEALENEAPASALAASSSASVSRAD